MKKLITYKIWIPLLLSPVLIGVGAYNFAIGNTELARAWFIWGLLSGCAGILWLLIAKRFNHHSSK